jgi:hypothetical protein
VARKIALLCGIVSSLLYVAMNIFVAMKWEGYSSASQTVSELSAIGAPTRQLWVIPGILYTLLMAIFGWGVWRGAAQNRPLRMVGVLLMIYGIIGLGWPFAPMHQREALVVGQGSVSDTLHIVFSAVTVLLMLIAIGFGSAAFGKRFRIYSIITIFILLLFGTLTGLDAPRLEDNLPTPWIGVWERISIGAFLLWVIILAIIIIRKGSGLPRKRARPLSHWNNTGRKNIESSLAD